jgi:hypothetical protein
MNKLTKIGVSALCGSLAAVSAANAGEMAVGGTATATWSKLSYGETGNPLGMATWLTFVGSGELDNGSTFSVTVAYDDKAAYSTSSIALTTPGLGTFTYDEGGGTGMDRFDDMLPTAWEEVDGTAVGAGLQTVSGAGGGSDIEWNVNADMLPDGMNLYLSYSPKADGGAAADKAGTGSTGGPVDGAGYDIALSHNALADGLNVFGAYSSISQGKGNVSEGDRTQYVLGATYAINNLTLAYQWSLDNRRLGDGARTSYYENNGYGVSFNINDDLSMSYARHDSERGLNNNTQVELSAESLQLAYSMGGASLKIAETEVDNATYDSTTAGDRDGTTIALSLAF